MTFIPEKKRDDNNKERLTFLSQIRDLIPGITPELIPDSSIESSPWLLQTDDDLMTLFPGSDSPSNPNYLKLQRALQFKVAAEMGYSTRVRRQEQEQQNEEYELVDPSIFRSNLIDQYNKIIASLNPSSVSDITFFDVVAFGD